MLDDHVVTLILVGHVQLIQEVVGGLAHLQFTGYVGIMDSRRGFVGVHAHYM